MEKKNYLILLALFVVFLLLYMVQKTGKQNYIAEDSYFSFLPDDIQISSIKSIKIFRGVEEADAVQMERSAEDSGKWFVSGYFGSRGDSSKIDNFLISIKNMEGELRSSTAGVFGEYGIADDEALHILLSGDDGKEIGHLLVGSKTVDNRNGFARFAGQEKVYYINRNLGSPAGIAAADEKPDPEVWVDLAVLGGLKKISRDDIKAFKVELEKFSGDFVREVLKNDADGTRADNSESGVSKTTEKKIIWKLSGKEIDKIKIDGLIGQLLRFKGTRVVDPSRIDEYGFGKYYFELSRVSGEKIKILVGLANDKFYLQVKGDSQVFEADVNNKLITGEDFIQDNKV